MSENKKVFFIINKYSGTGYRPGVERQIRTACETRNIECAIEFTKQRGHATDLARKAILQNADAVFAVGGDGTVNEVAMAMLHGDTPMGILPRGSGNGLARHLGIPMSLGKSLEMISSNRSILMDTVLLNNQLSVNVAGIGFDGHVAGLFGKEGKRGLIGYSILAIREFFAYKEFEAELILDGNPIRRSAFIIALANSCQFGNNARIAPNASVRDHLVEVCLIRKTPLAQVIGFTYKMFTGCIDRSALVEIKQAKKVTFQFSSPMAYHIDGESMESCSQFTIEVQPASLKMIVPEHSKRRF